MTEQDANNYLEDIYDAYFYNNKGIFINYMAVVKESNNEKITNDYIIEVGCSNNVRTFINNLKTNDEKKLKSLNLTKLYHQINEDIRWNSPKDNKLNYFIKNNKFEDIKKTEIPVLSNKVYYQSFFKSTKRHDKLQGGISISQSYNDKFSGTAGAFFKMKKSNEIYMITNMHVVDYDESDITHPSLVDVGENDIKPLRQIIGSVFWKSKNEDFTMDAAIIKIDSQYINKIKFSRCKGIQFNGIKKPKIGSLVKKCGRSSGLTCGYIRSVNCIVNVNTKDGCTPKLYKNQILTTEMSIKGDSGSVLVNEKNNVVGLLFAGSDGETYATDINKVINKVFKNDSIEFFY